MKALITAITAVTVSLSSTSFAWDNNDIDNAWQTQNSQQLTEIAANNDDFTGLYAHYRLAMLALHSDDKKTAKNSLDTIRKALKDDYKTADEAALFSAALGQSITLKPWQAAFIAGDAEDALEYSFELGDNHASTLMVKGIAQYNTPSLLGGDKAEALELFNKAIDLFAQQEAWGYEDALLWKAKAEHELGKPEAAQKTLANLLTLFPDYYEANELEFEK